MVALCALYAVYRAVAVPAVEDQHVTYVVAGYSTAGCSGQPVEGSTLESKPITPAELCSALNQPPAPEEPEPEDGWTCVDYPDGKPTAEDEYSGKCIHSGHCTAYESGQHLQLDVYIKELAVFATTKEDFNSAACSLCADAITAADEAAGVEYECSYWRRGGMDWCLWIGGLSAVWS